MKAFRACQAAASRADRSIRPVFETLFPNVPYVPSTFYSNRVRWQKADDEVRQEFIGYGRSEKGRWKHFLERTRDVADERAAVRNAVKRMRRAEQKKKIKVEEDQAEVGDDEKEEDEERVDS